MIKQEISNVPENNIIFNEAMEYPLRSFTFDPIIYFNEDDEVWICGVELAALDYTGTKVIISLYSAVFEDEKTWVFCDKYPRLVLEIFSCTTTIYS